MRNGNLTAAKSAKNDEFYTRREDIESELLHDDYAPHFYGKTVYCNCDGELSEFLKFFTRMFYPWNLKKVAATCKAPEGRGFAYELSDGVNMVKTVLDGDGDFRSAECVELLKEADIVVTNPPFSLFREYTAQLVEYGKKFLIIGSLNAVTYREFFPLLKDNQVWTGYGHPKRFIQPDGSMKPFGNIMWFTNLDIGKRHWPLDLRRCYEGCEAEYPRYDNYDAVECGRVDGIPCDYDGVMGVPITFLDRYCPEQFEITGITKSWFGAACKTYGEQIQVNRDGSRKRVMKLNDQPAVLRPPDHVGTYYVCGGREYAALYQRILIRRK